jgi:aprataxin and PNK-like factor
MNSMIFIRFIVQPTTTNSQTSLVTTDPNKRERCPYGETCYRKNLTHREQASHPGDPDWDKEVTDTNKKKPECPYGAECYRKNPDHFQEYHHARKRVVEMKNKGRTSKRKGNILINLNTKHFPSLASDDEDDDDGLPNEYDYNDSFLDDEDLEDSVRADMEGTFYNQ